MKYTVRNALKEGMEAEMRVVGTVDSQVRRDMIGLAIVVAVVVAIVVAFGIRTDWYGLATPRFQPGVQYEFADTMKSTVPGKDANGNEVAVATRQFLVDQTTMFPAAESSLVEDPSLPPNTFVFRKKMQPALAVGGNIVRGAYEFVEVRYHWAKQEKVPHLKRPR